MAFNLELPRAAQASKWKVKIWDKEQLEPPHATILRWPDKWRFNLRTGELMDGASWREIDDTVQKAVIENRDLLCRMWDRIHRGNPVGGGDDD